MEIEYAEGTDPMDIFWDYLDPDYNIDALSLDKRRLIPDAPIEAVNAFEEFKAQMEHQRKMGIGW